MNTRRVNLNSDIELLKKFRLDTELESVGCYTLFNTDEYLNRIRMRLQEQPDGQLLVEENDETIGQVDLVIKEYNNRRIGYVNLIYLVPAYRGLGYGKQIISLAENYFKKHQMKEYHLRVSSTNTNALKLYTAQGMEKIYKDSEQNWCMRKAL
ncbi:GNAT family N-acetyltransferase [Halobacillus faecis]